MRGASATRWWPSLQRGEGAAVERTATVQPAVPGSEPGADRRTTVQVGGREYRFEIDWSYGQLRVEGRCNGAPFVAQVERNGPGPTSCATAARRSRRWCSRRARAELLRLMPVKAPPDTSRLLLSPMPGLLVQVAVAPGQAVTAGERLAIVEAMKMENVLVAARDAVVEEVLAAPGDSLAVDQPIMRFA